MGKQWHYGNYDTMGNKKLWYFTENYGTSIYELNNGGRLPKTTKLIKNGKKTKLIYHKIKVFEQIYSFTLIEL